MKQMLLAMRYRCVLLCAFLLLAPSVGFGIVVHPDGEPNMAEWAGDANRPDANVVGKWGSNASCVVIAPKYVITTRHQCGGIGSTVEIGGTSYSIEQIWDHPNHQGKSVDLRVVKLLNANLEDYVGVYTDSNETAEPVDPNYIVIGGYGKIRGDPCQTSGVTYAYSWGSTSSVARFCTNRIDNIRADETYGSSCGFNWIADFIIADFDGPNSVIDDPNSTIYEGAAALNDSGGGWFIRSGGTWKVAGLSTTVEHNGESWFRDIDDPNAPDPDELGALRISSYADWILDIISVEGDLTGDHLVDLADFVVLGGYWDEVCNSGNNWCEGADFVEPYGDVDWLDLDFLVFRWLCDGDCN